MICNKYSFDIRSCQKNTGFKIQERYFQKKLQNLKPFEFTKISGSLRPI